MSWQFAIVAHVIVSALMTITARRLSLSNRSAFFIVGFITYMMIAIAGLVYSFTFGVPWDYLPAPGEWLYLLPAGAGITLAWLLHYKTIGLLGASNAMIVSMANYIGTALLGFLLLNEAVSSTFLVGAGLILTSIYVAFRIRPDEKSTRKVSRSRIVIIIILMAVAFSFGMMFEKLAIDSMGVWQYARFGWLMQFICASVWLLAIGRKELPRTDTRTIRGAALLGILTSTAGVFYILALSSGSLSGTILATSAKIALTSVLAYVMLRERNALPLRILALGLTAAGLWLLF